MTDINYLKSENKRLLEFIYNLAEYASPKTMTLLHQSSDEHLLHINKFLNDFKEKETIKFLRGDL